MNTTVSQKWVLIVPMLLAVFAVGVGMSNMSSGTGENTLRDALGSSLGAALVGGFIPAAILVVGLIGSWRSPSIGVAVTLGLVFLYLGTLGTWVSLYEGWVGGGLVSLLGTVGAAVYLTGLAITRRSPKLGGPFAAVGAVAMAVTAWWTIVLPIIALALAAFSLRRAQRFADEQHALS